MIKAIVFFSTFLLSYLNQKDPCEIFGSICFVPSQYNADYVVYIENDDNIETLSVFKEESKLMADEEGVWYISDAPDFADYRIFITSDRRMADFTIKFIEERAFAGCQ